MSASLCPRCRVPLSGPAADEYCPRCAGRLLLGTAAASDTEAVPQVSATALRLGEYELGEELGRGAMGVVYRARQPRVRREVAVKVILASRFVGEAARKRFLAEAELAAQLDHPNIVPIYEVGETPDGPFYAMKLIEGGTLADRISGGSRRREEADGAIVRDDPPPLVGGYEPGEAAALLAKLARAVHHAHERGVLHRDLKPGNILLDANGEPHITDFGLARQLGADSSLTLTGATLGTPAYMSPEQATGERGVTTATDIWSLGAILFHLLSGRPPFSGAAATDVLVQVRTQEPPRLRSLNSQIPADLETICLKCLEKMPARRYGSALALAEDLECWLTGKSILARPAAWTEKTALWVKRHRAVSALSAMLGVALLAGGVLLGLNNRELRAVVVSERIARAAEAEALRDSLVAQARAVVQSGRLGQRFAALDLLQRAAQLKLTPEVRDLAVVALANFDLRETSRLSLPITSALGNARLDELMLAADFSAGVLPSSGAEWEWRRLRGTASHRWFAGTKGVSPNVLDLSPDGQWLIAQVGGEIQLWTGNGERIVRRWPNADSEKQLKRVATAFRGDGGEAAVALEDGRVALVHLPELRETVIGAGGQMAQALAYDSAGTRLALVRADHVEIRRLREDVAPTRISLPGLAAWCAWSPDGELLAVSSDKTRTIEIKAADTGASVLTLAVDGPVERGVFHPDGQILAVRTGGEKVLLWQLPDTFPVLAFPGTGPILQFSQDGRQLAAAAANSEIVFYEVAASPVYREFRYTIEDRPPNCFCLDRSPDGRLLLSTDSAGLRFWDCRRREELVSIPEPSPLWMSARFHPDGKSIVYSPLGRGIFRRGFLAHESPTGNLTIAVTPPEQIGDDPRNFFTEFTTRGDWVVQSAFGNQLSIWPQGNARSPLSISTGTGTPIAVPNFSPDQSLAALCFSPASRVDLWSLAGPKLIRSLEGDRFNNAVFAPDGRWLVTGTANAVQLRLASDWQFHRTLATNLIRGDFADINFSPDGRLMDFLATPERAQIRSLPEFTELFNLQSARPVPRKYTKWSQDSSRYYIQGVGNRLFEWNLTELRQRLTELGLTDDDKP